MNRQQKLVVWSLVVLLLLVVPSVIAKEKQGPVLGGKLDVLTPAQMANAIEIANAANPSLRQTSNANQVYRLADCTMADAVNRPCYLVIRAGLVQSQPLAPTTYVCGVNVYNYVGWQVAVLKQSVSVNAGAGGFTANWGHLGGSSAWGAGYAWSLLIGPNPNPAWGAVTTGPAYFTAGGNLTYSIPPAYNYSMLIASVLTVNSGGDYSCQ